jgi:PST family polysaccharide transporter
MFISSSSNKSKANSDSVFQTDHLGENLRTHSVRGGLITVSSQAAKFLLSLGSTMILARLLTPEDFGLFGMVAAVTGFILLFKNMGLSQATIQREEINHYQISTLFWINVTVSTVIAILAVAIAPLIVWFYGEPRLLAVTAALSLGFVFGGLTVQHQALIRRQMRFGVLASVEITAIVSGIIAAIFSGIQGLNYWALVIQQLVQALILAIGVWVMCRWRPDLPVRKSGVRSMIAFGGNFTAFSILNYFARNFDKVLIGWHWGGQQLGFYAKAYQFLLLPINHINAPMTMVAIPGLSRLQNEPERFRSFYLKALSLSTFLTMPFAIALIVLTEEFVDLLLGPQWVETIPIFRFLAISALVQPICNTTGWVYLSTGRANRMLKWGVVYSVFIIFSFWVGLPFGARGVALSYAIATLLQTIPALWYAMRGTSITLIDLFHTIKEAFWASIVSGGIVFFIKWFIKGIFPSWSIAIMCSAMMAGIYILIMFYLFGKKDFYLSVLREFKRT